MRVIPRALSSLIDEEISRRIGKEKSVVDRAAKSPDGLGPSLKAEPTSQLPSARKSKGKTLKWQGKRWYSTGNGWIELLPEENPPAQVEDRKVLNGKEYIKKNGQWFEK